MTDATRADILAIAPKIVQAVFAALGDYFTAKLAGRLFGGVVGWTSVRLNFLRGCFFFGVCTFFDPIRMGYSCG